MGRIGGEDERWVTEMRLHEGGICVGKTDGGTGSCGRALTVKSRRWEMMGKGTHEGLPLRGTDVVVVVERVRQYGWGVPEPPLRRKVGDGG